MGLITQTGGFDFLFSIYLSAGQLPNPWRLPDGFSPINPPIHEVDIRSFAEFKPGSYLASASIEESKHDVGSGYVLNLVDWYRASNVYLFVQGIGFSDVSIRGCDSDDAPRRDSL